MPDDLPLARTAGELTRLVEVHEKPVPAPRKPAPAPTATDCDDVQTWVIANAWLWDAYFGVCLAAVALAIGWPAVQRDQLGWQLWTMLSLIGAMAAWYAMLGRSLVRASRTGWRGLVFQGGLLALFAAVSYFADITSFLLMAFCPLVYLTVNYTYAHVIVAVFSFTPALMTLLPGGGAGLEYKLPLGAVGLCLSVVLALTTERTERISRERASLISELESTRAEVARLSRETGIAQERQRLAGDIHDTIAQGLSSVVMLLEAASGVLTRDPDLAREHLQLAARTARENLDETRAIVAALTPAPLEQAPLEHALERLVARFAAQAGVAASITTSGETRPLPTGTEVVLLRVAQEALNNARKHAAAVRVNVALEFGPAQVALQVSDDGAGFDATTLSPGYGLAAMRARVEQIGGVLDITSRIGSGTTIRAEVPA